MGLLGKLLLVSVTLTALVIGYIFYTLNQVPQLPELENTWWGAGQPRKLDESIRNFKINISDDILHDLQIRLDLHSHITPPMENVNFEYGFNTDYLKKVVEFWKTKYNWREREVFLNKFPHFKTYVDGLDLHFIHVKPQKVDKNIRVFPLLLLHGWPGSVREFYDIIPLLTTPRKDVNFVFEVIVPSLPGYGFSEGASKPGLGPAQVAVVMKNLMERIGFKKFYAQGGDWGALIVSNMGTLFPKSLLGVHSNMCFSNSLSANLKVLLGSLWPTLIVDEAHVDKLYPVGQHYAYLLEEMGYMHLQATKPDTLGVALRDSPVGLAAYILEKFSTWTERSWRSLPDGGLTRKYRLTDLLDNVMIYWVTGSITTSVRLYSEAFTKAQFALKLDSIPSITPTACAAFPNELAYQPKSLLQEKYLKLVQYTDMPRGGHFAAFEEPELLADDVFEAVKIMDSKKAT
ncbi:Juvenile hormone epoxide hydrolase 1 [Cryptotermes secundus]|uniref:Epoxide hydrolase n=1 Tax=Cryptotermes secundus TaxID=105785 RepID=A0A2J7PHG7_9NEOP|nr:juvenile hormone epoxide hydrolase 1 [Cryptotermes secundus]XP_023724764.1 juvenile hormone epoxide hydrolase 1 [Cryptotermes secundus]PNF15772.1 Juvenile hormone epoxide hydrolase 1 [Cryptotermes secundus]PNF15773.1 Juvenile hormone epoxide hydrolase 1 [Cryptotermes secundus]PNF15774.1 Juvenile hormone epoxide hydrolase 1 [Cryptotermes secundus]PNF15775.1 Juvenile hormone epoxide hydrolase 1 [Cryptotermes secundus]